MTVSFPVVEAVGRELPLSEIPGRLAPLYQYWNLKRGRDPMPRRADIDPLDLPEVLGWISLVEIRRAPPQFVYRLVGSRLGYRPAGPKDRRPLDEVRPNEYRALVESQFRHVAETGRPTLCENTVTFPDGRFTYRRLALPLGTDRRTPDMLLLGADCDGNGIAHFHAFCYRELGNESLAAKHP